MIENMTKNSLFFKDTMNRFNQERMESPLVVELIDSQSKKCLQELEMYGATKYEGLFTLDDLNSLIQFQNKIEEKLGDKIRWSGNIDSNFNISHTDINYGQVRYQSKVAGWPAGSDILRSNKILNSIFKNWYRNKESEFYRGTLEWVYPAEYNHNPWHCDVVGDQLKAMILLSDVSIKNAPMYYAMGSHNINTEIELKTKHSLFINSTVKKNDPKLYRGNHRVAVSGGHCGYLSDFSVDNFKTIDSSDSIITIDNNVYPNFICTGNVGDVIMFESSGFHSGNICVEGVRKNIILTCPENLSQKNIFLRSLGKNNC